MFQRTSSFDTYVEDQLAIALAMVKETSVTNLNATQRSKVRKLQDGVRGLPRKLPPLNTHTPEVVSDRSHDKSLEGSKVAVASMLGEEGEGTQSVRAPLSTGAGGVLKVKRGSQRAKLEKKVTVDLNPRFGDNVERAKEDSTSSNSRVIQRTRTHPKTNSEPVLSQEKAVTQTNTMVPTQNCAMGSEADVLPTKPQCTLKLQPKKVQSMEHSISKQFTSHSQLVATHSLPRATNEKKCPGAKGPTAADKVHKMDPTKRGKKKRVVATSVSQSLNSIRTKDVILSENNSGQHDRTHVKTVQASINKDSIITPSKTSNGRNSRVTNLPITHGENVAVFECTDNSLHSSKEVISWPPHYPMPRDATTARGENSVSTYNCLLNKTFAVSIYRSKTPLKLAATFEQDIYTVSITTR